MKKFRFNPDFGIPELCFQPQNEIIPDNSQNSGIFIFRIIVKRKMQAPEIRQEAAFSGTEAGVPDL